MPWTCATSCHEERQYSGIWPDASDCRSGTDGQGESLSSVRSDPSPAIAMFESHDSFDHLVGAEQHAPWDLEAERLGGLQVDDQLELGRLLERDVARLRALENLVDETRRAPGQRGEVAL